MPSSFCGHVIFPMHKMRTSSTYIYICLHTRPTVIIDPAAAVGVDVGDHVVDIFLCQIVAQVLQDPAQFTDVDLSFLLLVQNAEDLLQLSLVLVFLHLLPDDQDKLVEVDEPGT